MNIFIDLFRDAYVRKTVVVQYVVVLLFVQVPALRRAEREYKTAHKLCDMNPWKGDFQSAAKAI